MTAPRHISTCIDEWLDGCPFNQTDAIEAIRQELDMQTRHTPTTTDDTADMEKTG